MTTYGEGKQWTFEEMNGFIYKPKDWIKGTAMGFAGMKKDQDRANLLAYMNQQNASPLDLPSPEAAAEEETAPEAAAEETSEEAAPAESEAEKTE